MTRLERAALKMSKQRAHAFRHTAERARERYGLELETQMPVEAKKFATNPRLKAQGWYVSTPGGHVNDALRHLYLFLSRRGLLVPPAGVI